MGMRDYTYDEVREIFSHNPTLLEEFDRAFPDVDAEDADEEDDEPGPGRSGMSSTGRTAR